MARFQVFIPTDDTAQIYAERLLISVGLSDLVAGAAPERSLGPGEQQGVVISWPDIGDSTTGYQPGQQVWLPAAQSGELESKRYWVGIWNEKPPTSKDLQRPAQYRGRSIALGDGHEWVLPMASELPADFILDESGSWISEIQPQFHDVFEQALNWYERITNADENTKYVEYEEIIKFVVPMLGLNYLITPEIVSELRILNKENSVKCLHAICGV